MTDNFYDKVAKKFGHYHTGAKYITEYPNGNPEEVFKKSVVDLSSVKKLALDAGCADGRFTLSMAPYFKKITAIDISKGMLDAANVLKKEKNITNVDFQYMDVHNISYSPESFDLIYNRRGPADYPQFSRLLKSGGYYVEINIGEKDAQEIKEVFQRGQNFGEWNDPKMSKITRRLQENEFTIVLAQEYLYNEYYVSYRDMDLFLQGVPIFTDFDSTKDKELLQKYTDTFQTEKGIRLSRHRLVTVAQKKVEAE